MPMDIVYSPAAMYDRGHKGIVAIACAGAFLAFLDATIVNIAFPDISSSFSGSGRDLLSWVLDGYFVVIAALLVPAGGLADRFGHKRIFLPASPASPPPACSARWRRRWSC